MLQGDHEVSAGVSAEVRFRQSGHLGEGLLHHPREASGTRPCTGPPSAFQQQERAADDARGLVGAGGVAASKLLAIDGKVTAEMERFISPAEASRLGLLQGRLDGVGCHRDQPALERRAEESQINDAIGVESAATGSGEVFDQR